MIDGLFVYDNAIHVYHRWREGGPASGVTRAALPPAGARGNVESQAGLAR